jgi:hypothetical protein
MSTGSSLTLEIKKRSQRLRNACHPANIAWAIACQCLPAISKQPKYSRLQTGQSSVRIGYFAWIWLQKVVI